jgi:hypothetical protein
MAKSMVDILKMARNPIMRLMIGSCDIQEYRSVKDPKTHVTKEKLVTVYTGQPCKLSYSKNPATAEGDAPGSLLSVRLILPSELDIKAGNVFTVTQAGKTRTFKAASEPAVYTNHQEVELESADKYA